MNSCVKNNAKVTLTHLLLLFICAASMNVINRYYYFIFLAVAIFCLKPNRRLYIDPVPVVSLLALAISWFAFSPESTTSIFAPIKSFAYLLCYVMGASLLTDDREYEKGKTPYKLFYMVILSIGAGMMIHYMLNWLTNLNSTERNTMDFWTKSIIVATGQAALACVPLGLAIACIFFQNKQEG